MRWLVVAWEAAMRSSTERFVAHAPNTTTSALADRTLEIFINSFSFRCAFARRPRRSGPEAPCRGSRHGLGQSGRVQRAGAKCGGTLLHLFPSGKTQSNT